MLANPAFYFVFVAATEVNINTTCSRKLIMHWVASCFKELTTYSTDGIA